MGQNQNTEPANTQFLRKFKQLRKYGNASKC